VDRPSSTWPKATWPSVSDWLDDGHGSHAPVGSRAAFGEGYGRSFVPRIPGPKRGSTVTQQSNRCLEGQRRVQRSRKTGLTCLPGDEQDDQVSEPDEPNAVNENVALPSGRRPSAADADDDGVDVSLIRWMLSLTPSERLLVLQDHVRATLALRGRRV
jgi:hypothetical protein